jgi:diadenosine tetraphosphatase ApaH/serine/threonine PP2A family protein phosphatase
MRIVVVSDIHSNLVALETVLAAAGPHDELWCLGDTIGYGPRPNECIALMRQHATYTITGNHDLACLAKIDLRDFNPDARKANIWNGEQLLDEHRAWLEQLEPAQSIDDRFTIAHGSPREPIWEYLLAPEQATANFALFTQEVCLIGHSHVQLGFRLRPDAGPQDEAKPLRAERFLPDRSRTVELDGVTRYFINPGSVGQPRDQDPRAAYAVIDTDTNSIRFNRVEYDIQKTQRQMQEAGLPTALIRRLEFGM